MFWPSRACRPTNRCEPCVSGTLKAAAERISYQLGLLCIDRITELQKSLELVVLGEGDYLHDCAKLGEDLHTPRNQRHRLQPE